MASCKHSRWLSLDTAGSERLLLTTTRLSTLVDEIPNADHQSASLVMLIGNEDKYQALYELAPALGRIRPERRRLGEVHLHFDSAPYTPAHPLLLADADFPKRRTRLARGKDERCHETQRWILPKAPDGDPEAASVVADAVFSRLLCPFVDVFCFFAADCRGFGPIVKHLALWLDSSRPSCLPESTFPRVIVVFETKEPDEAAEGAAERQFLRLLHEETTKDLKTRFSALEMVGIFPPQNISSRVRWRPLRECVLSACDAVRTQKRTMRTLFSAQHMAAFFELACGQFSRSWREPFDFVQLARQQNPVPPNLEQHLANFFRKIKSVNDLREFAVPAAASSILLSSYPPDMHVFNAADIFFTFYRRVCYDVSRTAVLAHDGSQDLILPSRFLGMMEAQLRSYFDEFAAGRGVTAATLHRDNLRRLRAFWATTHSADTCLVCLAHRPAVSLPCKHCLCETCLHIFGDQHTQDPWLFSIASCLLCGAKADLSFRLKPDTAGVRVLSVDGGGVRGIIPQLILKLIEDRIGLPYPVQNHFDAAFGISSGSLTILALFINGWAIADCTAAFRSLAAAAFQRRRVSRIPVLATIQRYLTSYLADSLYSPHPLEAMLRRTYGARRDLLDHSYANSIGARVGLPLTTIHGTTSCIFNNYNGVGRRTSDCGYRIMQEKDGTNRTLVWEIARAASAAPGYFPPKLIPQLGWFQDGAVWRNNPVVMALVEAQAAWQSDAEPDFVLSLGTGYSNQVLGSPSAISQRRMLRDGFIFRLYRAFFSSLSGKKVWEEFRNRRKTETQERYYRCDVEFKGSEPDLDQISQMDSISLQAQQAYVHSKELDRIARHAIASLFYFELDGLPKYRSRNIVAHGRILCKIPATNRALPALFDRLSTTRTCFCLDGKALSGVIGDRSFVGRDGSFMKRVELTMQHRDQSFSITLREATLDLIPISGFPRSLTSLITDQGLYHQFGRPDHKKRNAIEGLESPLRKRRRPGEGMDE